MASLRRSRAVGRDAGCSGMGPEFRSSSRGLRAGEENTGETGGSLGLADCPALLKSMSSRFIERPSQEKKVESDRGHLASGWAYPPLYTHTHVCAHTHTCIGTACHPEKTGEHVARIPDNGAISKPLVGLETLVTDRYRNQEEVASLFPGVLGWPW